MAIDIRVSRWIVATIRIIEATAARRWIVINRGASSWRRTAVTSTLIVIVATAGWASITVTVTARRVSTGWSTAVVVIRVGSASRRAGAGSVARNIRLGLLLSANAKMGER